MKENINTKKYWDERFKNNWEKRNGRSQTRYFAESQIKHLKIKENFSGSLLDFGCGLGDAIPVYKSHFPNAKLFGIDISTVGIEKCRERYGDMADFISGSVESMPFVDIVIASNVFEHISNDINIAKEILKKTKKLYIIVPYEEENLINEHINHYDEKYFSDLKPESITIFESKGWTEYGFRLFKLRMINIFNFFFGRKRRKRSMQIMYCLSASKQ